MGEFSDGGAGGASLDEFVDLVDGEPDLLLATRSRTLVEINVSPGASTTGQPSEGRPLRTDPQ